MIPLLRTLLVKPIIVSALLSLPLTAMMGCGRQAPERTEDPAEIEELRQQHLEHAERERQETR